MHNYEHQIEWWGGFSFSHYRKPQQHPSGWPRHYPPLSFFFYCPKCGDVWFKSSVRGEVPIMQHWIAYKRRCPLHGLGSLWLPQESGLLESLPRSFLERELKLAIANPEDYHGVIE